MLHEPQPDRPVRQLHRRRRDDAPTTSRSTRCRSITARSCTASSCPTSTSARTNVILRRRPTRPRSWRPSRPSGPRSCSARRRSGSRCCATRTSTAATSRRCARATTAPRSCRSRSSRELGRAAARRAAVQLLRPDRDVAAGDAACGPRTSSARPARPAGRRSTSRRRSSTTTAAPVPPGEVGEIVHRSPQAMLGYWNDPEKTAEAFRDGWFHSGDLGVLDDEGYLYVVDRKKDMIKTGGENVAAARSRRSIYAHPAVSRGGGVRHPAPALDRGRRRRRRAARRRRRSSAEEVIALLPRAPRRLQGPELRRHRRRAAQEPERQDPQARACARPTPASPHEGDDA